MRVRSKKTLPARGWTAADICTNCVYTIPAPSDGVLIPFLCKPTVASCRLAGSAPHKSGGRRVKSWPDDSQRLPPARGGTAQRKIFHLANRSQLIHPRPSSSRSSFFYGVESVVRGKADSLLN